MFPSFHSYFLKIPYLKMLQAWDVHRKQIIYLMRIIIFS